MLSPAVQFDFKNVTFTFLPHQVKDMDALVKDLESKAPDIVGVASYEQCKGFVETLSKYQKFTDIPVQRNDCLLINGPDTGYKDKIVIFAGGAASDSYKKKSEVTHTVCGLQPRSTCIMTTPSKRHSTDNWQPRTEKSSGT